MRRPPLTLTLALALALAMPFTLACSDDTSPTLDAAIQNDTGAADAATAEAGS